MVKVQNDVSSNTEYPEDVYLWFQQCVPNTHFKNLFITKNSLNEVFRMGTFENFLMFQNHTFTLII